MDDNKSPTTEEITDTMSVIQNLEGLIKTQSAQLERNREEMKKTKQMLADYLQNDATYKIHEEKVKEAAKVRNATKQQLLKAPQAQTIASKVKDMQSEVKELEKSLSEYLREYHRLSGIDTITGDDGETRQIVYSAKLVKKTAKPTAA